MICLGLIFLSVLNERATKCHGACCQREEGDGVGEGWKKHQLNNCYFIVKNWKCFFLFIYLLMAKIFILLT